jgi:hypothetical protein
MAERITESARKHWVQALLGAGLLLVGLAAWIAIGGRLTAHAASNTIAQPAVTGQGAQKYCQTYENALASDLNVSTATLERDNLDALQKTLDAMVRDNQITSFEESQIMQLARQVGTQPCAHLNAQALQTFLQSDPALIQQVLAARAALVSAVAKSLGISTDTLQSDLGRGQTVAQIAQARRVSLTSVRVAYLQAAQTYLAQAVSQGIITQAQSSAIYQALQSAVSKGAFPLLTLGGLGAA